tara:strand:- start:322 stop:531 length:210 start_codon:yes stop_codon:yes gene_type:complete
MTVYSDLDHGQISIAAESPASNMDRSVWEGQATALIGYGLAGRIAYPITAGVRLLSAWRCGTVLCQARN